MRCLLGPRSRGRSSTFLCPYQTSTWSRYTLTGLYVDSTGLPDGAGIFSFITGNLATVLPLSLSAIPLAIVQGDVPEPSTLVPIKLVGILLARKRIARRAALAHRFRRRN